MMARGLKLNGALSLLCLLATGATRNQSAPLQEQPGRAGYTVLFKGQLIGPFGGCTNGQEFLLSNGAHFMCTSTQQARIVSSPVFQIVQRYGEPEKYIIGDTSFDGKILELNSNHRI